MDNDLQTIEENGEIFDIDNYTSYKFEFQQEDTPIGEASVHFAFVVTDKYEASFLFVSSVESDIDGSLAVVTVEKIWGHLLESVNFY